MFPFREESDSWPTASGNSVNCARSQKNIMKKRHGRISRRGERVQSQLPWRGSKRAREGKNKNCKRHKLTCKASSVGPLIQTISICSLQQRDFLPSSNCPPIYIYFICPNFPVEDFKKAGTKAASSGVYWFSSVQWFVALRLSPASLRTDCVQTRTRTLPLPLARRGA